jgi:hypothetical protein
MSSTVKICAHVSAMSGPDDVPPVVPLVVPLNHCALPPCTRSVGESESKVSHAYALNARHRETKSSVDPPVLDPMRLIRLRTHLPLAILLVVLVVALEPLDVAVTLEGEDVGRDTVEEPAIMGDDEASATASI